MVEERGCTMKQECGRGERECTMMQECDRGERVYYGAEVW